MKKVLFFGVAILAARKLVPWILTKFASLKVTESVITGALIICFLYAYIAELMGVAAIIGAYIAGLALNLTKFKHVVFKKAETISYSLFVPVFFTSIGLQVSFEGISQHLSTIVWLSILAILTKLIGAAVGAKLVKFSWSSSLGIGAAMVSRGEVALIIAAIGLESHLISQELFAILVIVVLVTTIATPPMMKYFFNRSQSEKSIKVTA